MLAGRQIGHGHWRHAPRHAVHNDLGTGRVRADLQAADSRRGLTLSRGLAELDVLGEMGASRDIERDPSWLAGTAKLEDVSACSDSQRGRGNAARLAVEDDFRPGRIRRDYDRTGRGRGNRKKAPCGQGAATG